MSPILISLLISILLAVLPELIKWISGLLKQKDSVDPKDMAVAADMLGYCRGWLEKLETEPNLRPRRRKQVESARKQYDKLVASMHQYYQR